MTVVAGTRVGIYEIIGPLGAGGMGEVYRARDAALGRDVALKLLPDGFAADPDRVARFEREARTLAALNHPHIAQIHGIEQSGGRRALVMELVDGEDLAQRLTRGPVPIADAIAIATQIAEALEAAHGQGVVHRDLKPANVMMRGDGVVKLLDFGLAKAFGATGPGDGDSFTDSPTITSPALMTERGVILGTTAYMAPEQARGGPVDKRADLWAFGIVLFEMLAGQRPFGGTGTTEVLAQILERAPDWGALPAATPVSVRRLLARCLEKDPKRRLRDAGDAMLELAHPHEPAPAAAAPSRRAMLLALAAIAGALAGALLTWLPLSRSRPAVVASTVAKFPVLSAPRDIADFDSGRPTVAITPDGQAVVFVAGQQLFVRAVDELSQRPLAGTEPVQLQAGARGNTGIARAPIVSPDGNDVAYGQGLELKRVPISGGTPTVICPCEGFREGTWSSDGSILYAAGGTNRGVWRVPAKGGAPEPIIRIDAHEIALKPQLLPDREHVLFSLTTGEHWDKASVVVQSIRSQERQVILEQAIDGRYLATGHILFGRDGVLYAVPFDDERRQLTGAEFPVLAGVWQQTSAGAWGGFDYAISNDGSLVYVPSQAGALRRALITVDRSGHQEQISSEPRAFQYPRLSPDGQRVALDLRDQLNDVWEWDLRRNSPTRLTFNRRAGGPAIWTQDGSAVLYAPDVGGVINIHRQSTAGGEPVRLMTSPSVQFVDALTKDGKYLVFEETSPTTKLDLRLLRLDAKEPPTNLIHSPFDERNADLSPDDKWIAYQSNESGGRDEVYVRPFPRVDDDRRQVSTSGGTRPLWSRDGRELFFLDQNRRMTTVSVAGERSLSFGLPQPLFDTTEFGLQGQQRNFDLAPDGKRFLMVKNLPPLADVPALVLIQNWFAELRAKSR